MLTQQEVEEMSKPGYFFNHGENPAMKNLLEMTQHNIRDGKIMNHRNVVQERGTRFFSSRNLDDFLHRDLKIYTARRALAVWVGSTMAFLGAVGYTSSLIPVGRRGFTRVSQTPFYRAFGPLGVGAALLGAGMLTVAYLKTSIFCARKVWFVGVKGERVDMWQKKNKSVHFEYKYLDDPMSCPEAFTEKVDDLFKGSEEPFKQGHKQSPYDPLRPLE